MKTFCAVLAAMIAAIAILLLPACALRKDAPDPAKVQEQIAEYRNQELDLVRSTVLDPERAGRLIDLLADRDRLTSDSAKEVAEYRERMTALNADYDSTRESFDELFASYNSRRKSLQIEIVALIEAMNKETTAEEWKVISKYQLKRLHPRNLSYAQPSAGG